MNGTVTLSMGSGAISLNQMNGKTSFPWMFVVGCNVTLLTTLWVGGVFHGALCLESLFGFSGNGEIREFSGKTGFHLRK